MKYKFWSLLQGSGIYAGKYGPIKVYQPRKTSNALIIAEIPKYRKGQHVLDLKVKEPMVIEFKDDQVPTISGKPSLGKNFPSFQDDLRPYTTKVLHPREPSVTKTLCNRGLCCDFEVEFTYDRELVAGNPGAKKYRYITLGCVKLILLSGKS